MVLKELSHVLVVGELKVDNGFGKVDILLQELVVEGHSLSQICIMAMPEDLLEELGHDRMNFRGPAKEQFDACNNQIGLKLNGAETGLILLFIDDLFEHIGRLRDVLTEGTENPNEGRFTAFFNKFVEVFLVDELAELFDQVRVLSQDVLKHDHGFIDNICNFKIKEVAELTGNILGNLRKTDDDGSEAPNGSLSDIGVDISHILAQLIDDLLDVVLRGNLTKNFKFYVLDVAWLIVLHEELLVLVLEHQVAASLHK